LEKDAALPLDADGRTSNVAPAEVAAGPHLLGDFNVNA